MAIAPRQGLVEAIPPRYLARSRHGLMHVLLLAACEPAPVPPPAADTRIPAEAPPPEANGTMAVTIDDLPWVGDLPPGLDRAAANRRLLEALTARGVPATGFVNCGREPAGSPILRLWQEAGMEIGNHTEQHLDLNRADVDAWIADARSCDRRLREVTGRAAVPFRYPYLHRGPTVERYRRAREAVDALGGPIAPVTINTADWVIDDAYIEALRAGDAARAREIGEALVEHVLLATAHYQERARERVGRDVSHILLLHANTLLADHLGTLIDRLGERGFRFVSLEEALRDPVYAMPDVYIGREGLSWLYRFEPPIPEAHAWDTAEAARLRDRYR